MAAGFFATVLHCDDVVTRLERAASPANGPQTARSSSADPIKIPQPASRGNPCVGPAASLRLSGSPPSGDCWTHLSGEMSEWSIERAWKLIPLARADAHHNPPTHSRSTTSRNIDMRRRVPVNDGV